MSRSLLALALLSGIALTFYIFVSYRVLFDSDSAAFNLLADEIIRTRQLFPSDWYYINDISLLTPHLIIVPLALLFSESFVLHATACFVFAGLFAFSLYLLCRVSGLRTDDFLFAISLLFTGLSALFAKFLFGEFAYGGSVASTFVVIALVLRTLRAYHENNRRSLSRWSALLVAFLSVVLVSGVRGLFLDVVPTLATLAIVLLAQQMGRVHPVFRGRAIGYVGLLVVVATLLGMAGFVAIRSGIHFQSDKSAARYVDYQQLKSNIGIFFEGFLAYAGAMPAPNKRPMSVYGFITAYRLFWFGLVLLAPFWLLFRSRRAANPYFQFLLVFYGFSFISTSYLYVFSSLTENVATFRYCISPCVLAVVLVGYAASELRLHYGAKGVCLLVAACLPLYASSYQQLIAPYFEAKITSGHGTVLHENARQPLADYLVNQNLRYGYATYWNAGAVTLLSGERTHVNAILLGDNPPASPFRWLTAGNAYASPAFQGRTFLLVTDEENRGVSHGFGAANKVSLQAYLGPPESVKTFSGYSILVYGFNLAAKLPGWEETQQLDIDDAYTQADLKADLECKISEMTMESGKPGVLQVQVTNRGGKVFASAGQFPIYSGIHLYSGNLQLKNFNYMLSTLPHLLKSGESLEFPAPLAPLPKGDYTLEVSMVQGGVAWFGTKKDGQPLRIKLKVQ